jgi:hypothetical protein
MDYCEQGKETSGYIKSGVSCVAGLLSTSEGLCSRSSFKDVEYMAYLPFQRNPIYTPVKVKERLTHHAAAERGNA